MLPIFGNFKISFITYFKLKLIEGPKLYTANHTPPAQQIIRELRQRPIFLRVFEHQFSLSNDIIIVKKNQVDPIGRALRYFPLGDKLIDHFDIVMRI